MMLLSDPAEFVARAPVPAREGVRPAWLSLLEAKAGEAGEFRPQASFAPASEPAPDPITEEPQDDTEAQLKEAFELGRTQGRAEATQEAESENAERRKLGIALRRLESDLRDQFAAMLDETVKALCEASFAHIALDTDLLARRCEHAAAMVEEAQDAITLRLSPQDIARLDPEFRAHWTIAPDPDLAQGELRVEGREGAVLDGPREWSRALAEALETC